MMYVQSAERKKKNVPTKTTLPTNIVLQNLRRAEEFSGQKLKEFTIKWALLEMLKGNF